FGNGGFTERAADWVVADPGLDGVDSADPTVAHELTGQSIARIRPLLAARLEDAVVFPRSLSHRLSLLNRQREGLLAIDVAAGLHRGDRRQCVPVIDSADRHGVKLLLGQQLAKIVVGMAIL